MAEDLMNFEGQQSSPTILPFNQEPVDVQNAATKASQDWASADRNYYSKQEQSVGGLIGEILAIGGGVFAPYLAPMIGASLGIPTALASALVSGGAGAFGGIVAGEDPGKALLGGLEGGAGSLLGAGLGDLAKGAFGSAGGGFGGAASGAVDFSHIDPSIFGDVSSLSNVPSSVFTNAANSAGGLFGTGSNLGGLAGADGFSGHPTLNLGGGGDNLDLSQPIGGTPSPLQGDPAGNFRPLNLPFGSTDLSTALGGAAGAAGGGENTVSPLEVTGAPTTSDGLGLTDPATLISNTGGSTINDFQKPITTGNSTDPGKPDIDKLLNTLAQLIGGGAGGVVASRPSPTGPGAGPTGGGGSNNPTGGGPQSGPNPYNPSSANGGAAAGAGAAAPGLITAGAGTGGAGVGLGGPGQADVRGSTAPDIYPWVGQGGSGGL